LTPSSTPWLEALRCTVRVLADSERTQDIVTAEEIICQRRLRQLLSGGLFDQTVEGRELFADQPLLVDADLDELRALPADSLGGTFVRFLDDNRLDYGITRQKTPYTDDPDARFLLHRLRQSHDLWHALLGLGIRGHQEVLIHAFSFAQTGIASSALIVALGGLKHMVGERRWRALHPGVWRAYRAGQCADPLLAVYWERHWHEPIDEVRARYHITPIGNE